MKQIYLDKALEQANDLKSIKDIDCPREAINPGLYFGFVRGVKAVLETENIEELREQNTRMYFELKNLRKECDRLTRDTVDLIDKATQRGYDQGYEQCKIDSKPVNITSAEFQERVFGPSKTFTKEEIELLETVSKEYKESKK